MNGEVSAFWSASCHFHHFSRRGRSILHHAKSPKHERLQCHRRHVMHPGLRHPAFWVEKVLLQVLTAGSVRDVCVPLLGIDRRRARAAKHKTPTRCRCVDVIKYRRGHHKMSRLRFYCTLHSEISAARERCERHTMRTVQLFSFVCW